MIFLDLVKERSSIRAYEARPVPEAVLMQVLEAGRLALRALAKVRRDAKIAILHIPLNKACIDRVDGLKSELAKFPQMQILAIRDGKLVLPPTARDVTVKYQEPP